MIRLPGNRNYCFPGGVGDPSAVANGEYRYAFYGEYAYPSAWSAETWDSHVEAQAQCVSVARIPLDRLDEPNGAARRWNGSSFDAAWNAAGAPIASLRIARQDGGGAVSQGDERYYWGPSVSWNEYLECWVMLLGCVDGSYWVGDSLFMSINPHRDLGLGHNSQDWSTPIRIVHRPGHTLWYPSLQPSDSPEDIAERQASVRLGREARLFFRICSATNTSTSMTSELRSTERRNHELTPDCRDHGRGQRPRRGRRRAPECRRHSDPHPRSCRNR